MEGCERLKIPALLPFTGRPIRASFGVRRAKAAFSSG
jgi:hypothetical protein